MTVKTLHELLIETGGDLFTLAATNPHHTTQQQRMRASLYATPPKPVYVHYDSFRLTLSNAVLEINEVLDAAHAAFESTLDPDAVEVVRSPKTDTTDTLGYTDTDTIGESDRSTRPTFTVGGAVTINEINNEHTGAQTSTHIHAPTKTTHAYGEDREVRRKIESPREAMIRLERYNNEVFNYLKSTIDQAINAARWW